MIAKKPGAQLMEGRRYRPRYTVDELLNLVISAPLPWPGRTIRLDRDSLFDYAGRPASPQTSVAELYHENSKLSRELLPQLTVTAANFQEFREEYLRRRAVVARTLGADDWPGADFWSNALSLMFEDGSDLCYAIDLRLVVAEFVVAYEPAAGVFQRIKDLDAVERRELTAALGLIDPVAPASDTQAFMLLVACFPRNEIFFGQHGYRRTLIEAGQIAEKLRERAARAGRTCLVHSEFSNRDVDLIMEVDGIEQSVVVALELC
jgi:hypothetical protein